MFFIKKQFNEQYKNIISLGVFSFCFFAGFGLLFYSFFIIYPIEQISDTEDQNIIDVSADINIVSKPFDLSKVKINVNTEIEFQKIKNAENKEAERIKEIEKIKQEKIKEAERIKEIEKIKQKKINETKKAKETEIGMASWYCPRWCNKLTAAHPKYPKGTKLKVTNLKNKKSVIVIVNDFGPIKAIHPNRIIDLTKTAFQKIASIKAGKIKVMVEKL